MKPIIEPSMSSHCYELLREMMSGDTESDYEFRPEWIRDRGWKVVPVESMARIPRPDIPRITSALNSAGFWECLAIATEDLGDMPTCYALSVTEEDFLELNRELGPFRFLLTDETRSWAISCNEYYNLFAGKPELIEAVLGEPIQSAERKFLEFAMSLADGDPTYPLLSIAKRYAA